MLLLSLHSIISSIMLVTALSLDAFVASFCYGSNKIKIPFKSVAIISITCSAILALSLFLGVLIKPYLPYNLTNTVSFLILVSLGIVKFFDGCIKTFINKHKTDIKQVSFKLYDLRFILQIYADSTEADKDGSKELSPFEAASLSIALSFDGLAVGFGSGLSNVNPVEIILISIILGTAAVLVGSFIGNKLAEKVNLDLSWASGILLIVIAFLKL